MPPSLLLLMPGLSLDLGATTGAATAINTAVDAAAADATAGEVAAVAAAAIAAATTVDIGVKSANVRAFSHHHGRQRTCRQQAALVVT
jgi:hypothetical protein